MKKGNFILNMDKQAKLKCGCTNMLKKQFNCFHNVMMEDDYVDKQLAHYEKLMLKPPPELALFKPLIDIVLLSDDKYRIVWLGNKLHSIYLGKEYINHVPYSWEDEVELGNICNIILQ